MLCRESENHFLRKVRFLIFYCERFYSWLAIVG